MFGFCANQYMEGQPFQSDKGVVHPHRLSHRARMHQGETAPALYDSMCIFCANHYMEGQPFQSDKGVLHPRLSNRAPHTHNG